MPTVDENRQQWDERYGWQLQGDEWSRVWGGASSQWFGTLLPRLKSFLPTSTILEIAPGFGRWTQFLRPLCDALILVDLSEKCIEACKRRFAGDESIEYYVNDGCSLAMVPDGSVDLAFSFDSLVHVEADALVGYFAQLTPKLTPQGVAFIHHSNLGEYVDPMTGKLRPGIENRHWRALSVSAEMVREACARHGLYCVSQEIINWGGDVLNDTLTVVALPGSRWAGQTIVVRNTEFMREAKYVAGLAKLYDWGAVGGRGLTGAAADRPS